jgi:hypothetical protein
MSATGPFANTERAALLGVVAGAVATVAEEEPDEDGLELEEEEVPGREVPEVTLTVGNGIVELPDTVEDVPAAVVLVLAAVVLVLATGVLECVAAEVGIGDTVMGPGPRLDR